MGAFFLDTQNEKSLELVAESTYTFSAMENNQKSNMEPEIIFIYILLKVSGEKKRLK